MLSVIKKRFSRKVKKLFIATSFIAWFEVVSSSGLCVCVCLHNVCVCVRASCPLLVFDAQSAQESV